MASDDADESSKTEDPSAKRIEDARKHGDVSKSPEVVTWFMLGGTGAVLAMMAPWTASSLMQQLKVVMANADQYEVGGPAFGQFVTALAQGIIGVALIPMAVLTGLAVVANLIQHRPLVSLEPLVPKLRKISPLTGFRRLFSIESVVNLGKGVIKIAIVGAVMFYVFWPETDRLSTIVTADPAMVLQIAEELVLKIFWAAVAIMTVIAVADFVYQRNRWWNKHKMTLQEVRDEFKQMEGDPKIKGRVRQIRMERARKRMMAQVPQASVIIANPTHYAIALKYDRGMPAPVCVAKGVDDLALRIRALAEEHSVPVVENPPLARALYASVDIDKAIPAEHFKAVAQVIGYVMRLRQRRSWRSSAAVAK
ncbi:MAG: flagellar biosynthesis protein FlhB [Devosia sp.]|nr:flagellar biosynthesis protein FlhB [Devosia sp.]